MANPSSELLHPETQKEFWKHIDPSVFQMFVAFESQEDWTYTYDELPELFIKTAESLPEIASFPLDTNSQKVAHALIKILASMPLRECLFALTWLDSHDGNSELLWGEACYLESERVLKDTNNQEMHVYANILSQRVKIINKSRIAISIFQNIKSLEGTTL